MDMDEIVNKVNKDIDEIGNFIAHAEDDSIYIKNTEQTDILSYELHGILDVMKKYNYKFHAIEHYQGKCWLVFGIGDI